MSLALKFALMPLLLGQAALTRRRLPRLPEAEGPRAGEVGDGVPLRLLMAGDSSAAGVGVVHQQDALAGQLAPLLARACSARVRWQLLARSGVSTAQTLQLLHDEPAQPADIALVVTGVNDLIEQVPSHRAVAAREAIAVHLHQVRRVRHVVFAPLPPVHRLVGLPQPLRWVAGSDARRHNRALHEWAAARDGVSSVAMEDLQLNRGTLASDGFHPGAPAYRFISSVLAEHITARVWPSLQPSKASP